MVEEAVAERLHRVEDRGVLCPEHRLRERQDFEQQLAVVARREQRFDELRLQRRIAREEEASENGWPQLGGGGRDVLLQVGAGDPANLRVVVARDAIEHRLEDVVPFELHEGIDGELADAMIAIVERFDQRRPDVVRRPLPHHPFERVVASLRWPVLEGALHVRVADLGGELHRELPGRAQTILLRVLQHHIEHGLHVLRLASKERLAQGGPYRRIRPQHRVEQRHDGAGARAAQEERARSRLNRRVGARKERDEVLALEPLRGRDGFEERLLLCLVFECPCLERLERGLLPPDLVLHPVKHSARSLHHASLRGKRRVGSGASRYRTSTSFR